MRIAIATDCWRPQVDGITRTLEATARELHGLGHDVLMITPDDFASITLPYGDVAALPWYPRLARKLRSFAPNTVHIATQGPVGVAARVWCRLNGVHVTTAFHTRFPEYGKLRHRIPERLLYAYARLFHGRSAPVLVPSRALAGVLQRHGIAETRIWSRGVDTQLYRPRQKTWSAYRRPLLLYVGRVVEEKNVEAFLSLAADGTRIVVGSGPRLQALTKQYPEVVFLGEKHGHELARCYAEADVFVFPSLLDTFGLVILEALASGVPVAAFPSPHLAEVFAGRKGIVTRESLAEAVSAALECSAAECRQTALAYSWRAATEQLVEIIVADMETKGWDTKGRDAKGEAQR
jgi:glycosyltransferase involved in cell wall biosynthesis